MTKPSITKAALALLLCGVAGVTPVLAGARESVREILSARHAISMTADDWRKLGADVDRHLIEAAGDAALNYGARQRAMSGLAVVGGPRAQEFLRVTIERSKVAPALLSSAVYSYARGFAGSDPEGVRLLSAGLLGHQDWMVRQGAVRALGELGTKEAHEALRGREPLETHPAVQSALRTALAQPDKERR